MDRRGTRLFGRELDLPKTAATVRVVGGETLVADGPFAETKEFVAGLDRFECADLDEAIAVAVSSPVCRFHPIEIRPFRGAAGAPVLPRMTRRGCRTRSTRRSARSGAAIVATLILA